MDIDFVNRVCFKEPTYNFYNMTAYGCSQVSSIKIFNNIIQVFYGSSIGNGVDLFASGKAYSPDGNSLEISNLFIRQFNGGNYSSNWLNLKSYNSINTLGTVNLEIKNGKFAITTTAGYNCSGWQNFQDFTCDIGYYIGNKERCEKSF